MDFYRVHRRKFKQSQLILAEVNLLISPVLEWALESLDPHHIAENQRLTREAHIILTILEIQVVSRRRKIDYDLVVYGKGEMSRI